MCAPVVIPIPKYPAFTRGVTGYPSESVMMPLTCQPDTTIDARPPLGRTGRTHEPLTTRLLRTSKSEGPCRALTLSMLPCHDCCVPPGPPWIEPLVSSMDFESVYEACSMTLLENRRFTLAVNP